MSGGNLSGYITFIHWLLPQQPWYKYLYHTKSRLNTPVWGSLRSPNYIFLIGECGSTLYVGLSGIVQNLIQKSTV